MVLIVSELRFYVIQEILVGQIAQESTGRSGFGYDPIFYIAHKRKTVGEMRDVEKDAISHRARAARRMGIVLSSLEKENDDETPDL